MHNERFFRRYKFYYVRLAIVWNKGFDDMYVLIRMIQIYSQNYIIIIDMEVKK